MGCINDTIKTTKKEFQKDKISQIKDMQKEE